MTTISTSSPLASYFANTAKASNASAVGTTSSNDTDSASQDPLAEIRLFASTMVSNSRGGLLRAMQAESTGSSAAIASDRLRPAAEQGSDNARIALPDVAAMDRDDAAKLLAQVEKLFDAGLDQSDSFVGYNGDQQTQSLSTYRDWLQAKGGVSIYV